MLKLEDGFPRERPESRAEVAHLQRLLKHLGAALKDDGYFGEVTGLAVKEFQRRQGIAVSGIVDRNTWVQLEKVLLARPGDGDAEEVVEVRPTAEPELVAAGETLAEGGNAGDQEPELLPGFRGDLNWVHRQEGHSGKPYWPGGRSGVTLDPGFDLGYQEMQDVQRHYGDKISDSQLQAVRQVLGTTGRSAKRALNRSGALLSIRVSRAQALEVMPAVAQPYWSGIARRFAGLLREDTLGSVQTALLSLAYNRGIHNSDLGQLEQPIESKDWRECARRIGRMQQNHSLRGIRLRRQREAELILDEVRGLSA